jgi:Flp pilus assembly protein protease CpaA
MLNQLLLSAFLIVITAIYAVFDVFNKREIPNLFVYATVVIAFAITLTYGYSTIMYSIAIAVIVAIPGYLLYKKGFLGGGDFLEFVAISLILPIQPNPILYSEVQIPIPFIISVLLAAGYTVSIYIPLYYLRRSTKKPIIDKNRVFSGLVLLVAYAILITIMYAISYIGLTGIIILGIIGIASFFIIIYESSIYSGMVEMVLPASLEQGDMIATNLMDKKDIEYFTNISKNFDRLVTKKLLSEIKDAKKKLPVYRNSVPFALFIFFGVIISLLFGNLMLLILT